MSGIIPAPGANSSGSKFKRRSYTPIADINVTPFVDVRALSSVAVLTPQSAAAKRRAEG